MSKLTDEELRWMQRRLSWLVVADMATELLALRALMRDFKGVFDPAIDALVLAGWDFDANELRKLRTRAYALSVQP